MSVSYYAYTYLGFEVSKEDLWCLDPALGQPSGETRMRCGHPATAEGDFCPQCGDRLTVIHEETGTPAMRVLESLYDPERDGEEGAHDEDVCWELLTEEGLGEHGVRYCSLDPVQSSESGDSTKGIAIRLAEVDEYSRDVEPIWEGDLRDKIAALTDLSKKMFGEERTVKLYTVLYVSI